MRFQYMFMLILFSRSFKPIQSLFKTCILYQLVRNGMDENAHENVFNFTHLGTN